MTFTISTVKVVKHFESSYDPSASVLLSKLIPLYPILFRDYVSFKFKGAPITFLAELLFFILNNFISTIQVTDTLFYFSRDSFPMTFDEAFDVKEILFIFLLGLNSSYLILPYFSPI